MSKITSILAVFDRSDADVPLLAKACRLARQFGARLELFMCDAEHAYRLKHEYDTSRSTEVRASCLAQALDYLRKLKNSAGAADLQISVDALCESPLYEGIVRKVMKSRPDLVMKSASGALSPARATFDPNDWQLMRKCPVTLMMTRGRSWHPSPKLGAAVDVSAEETAGLAKGIVDTARTLAEAQDAQLEIVYGERGGIAPEAREARNQALQDLGRQSSVAPEHIHVLDGDPERTLPEFARTRDFDVLVLGALTHRPGLVTLVGTLTSKLMDAMDCDFVLVKPERARHEGEMIAPEPTRLGRSETAREHGGPRHMQRATPAWWQLVFGD